MFRELFNNHHATSTHSGRDKHTSSVPNSDSFIQRPVEETRRYKQLNKEEIPEDGMSGTELLKGVRVGRGRKAILSSGSKVEQVQHGRHYSKRELINKRGRAVKISTMPDRAKGGSFRQGPNIHSQQIIREQVESVSDKFFNRTMSFDESNARWAVVPHYILPEKWHHITCKTPLMVVFPDEYPMLPPIGFYMKADIEGPLDGHLYSGAYHEAWSEPLKQGWKWYCIYIHDGAWQPARNWQIGDNLFTYFHLIREALQGDDD